jgi:drug/metabolite transporter (DMT)-like permease
MTEKKNLKAYAAWITICIIWGTTYLAIKIGVEDFPPVLFAGFRWLIAGPILIIIMRIRGYKFPEKEDLIHLGIVGILLLGFGNVLVVVAEQYISSGLTSLIITTTPFWMVLFERFMYKKGKVNKFVIIGLLLGLAGVILIFSHDIDTVFKGSFFIGAAALLVAVIGWANGTLYSKYKKVSVDPLMGAAFQMLIAGVILTLLGFSIGEYSFIKTTDAGLYSLLYLIVFGSLIGYTSYIYAVAHLPISLVSTYAYINPVIAVFLGWLVLSEPLNIQLILGGIVILFGVWMVKKGAH